MIDIGIVDTHLHIWDTANLRYPWLADVPRLNQSFLPDDYRKAMQGIRIEKMVFVQCECDFSQFKNEVAWVTEQARKEPRIRGIVAWAPLEKGKAVRDDLSELAGNPLVKGIRRIIQFEDDPAFCLHPDFVTGVRMLADFGMHFEICIKGDEQFKNTIELVRQCPEVPFILDHIGKPYIKEKIIELWGQYLKTLAGLPNTWCKMSGLVNEADWVNWTAADLKPYIEHVFECFGFDRVMFGGDWPVCTLAADCRQWLATLREALEGCSQTQKEKIFKTNAEKFYRLGG